VIPFKFCRERLVPQN